MERYLKVESINQHEDWDLCSSMIASIKSQNEISRMFLFSSQFFMSMTVWKWNDALSSNVQICINTQICDYNILKIVDVKIIQANYYIENYIAISF